MKKEIIGDCTLYLGDCMELMESMPDKSVDAVVTDPPYGDRAGYGRMNKTIENNTDPIANLMMLQNVQRIINDGLVFNFTTWRHYPFIRFYVETYTGFDLRHCGVWAKNRFGMGAICRPAYEMFLILDIGGGSYYRKDFCDVQKGFSINHDQKSHPHEKPINILANMITHSTTEGQTVFDPFMGSGSGGVACLQEKRKFIGCEINQGFFDIACKRIEQANRQFKLF